MKAFIPKISIIILNYNSVEDTLACAENLLRTQYSNSSLIILDNASTDDSMEKLRDWSCSVDCHIIDETMLAPSDVSITIIKNFQNYGFAGGNATGVRYALANNADYIILLNNDTLVEPDFIQPLLNVYGHEKNAGIVGGIIRYENNRSKIWFSGGETGWYREGFHKTDSFNEKYRESPFVSGCLMMIPSNLIRQIGFMDEHYFLYVEDVDYCTHVRRHGYRNFVARDSIIYHKIGHSTGGGYSPLAYYYSTRNRLYYHYKHYKKFDFLIFFILFVSIKMFRWCLFTFQGNKKSRNAMIKGIIDFFQMNPSKKEKKRCYQSV